MKTVIIMGSTSDQPHAKKITDKLDEYGIAWTQHAASAHKQPLKVLEILTVNKDEKDIVYITIAGRSMHYPDLWRLIVNSQRLGVRLLQIKQICW